MKKFKKGFTIVELVIVIAVIAILAGVLIPVFSNVVDKANKSKDTQLVRNLNEALAVDLDEHNTMYDALQAAKEFGYDVGKINASATDNEILWDSVNDCFVYLNGGKLEYIPNTQHVEIAEEDYHKLWKIVDSVPANQKYSLYASNKFTATEVEVTVGFDAGENDDIAKVTYTGAKEVAIRTNGGTLVINNGSASVNHYGTSEVVDVLKAAGQSYHLFGQVGFLKVTEGRVVAEKGAEIKGLHIADNAAKVVINTEAVVETVSASTGVTVDNQKVTGIELTAIVPNVDPEKAQSGSELFARGFGESYAPYIIETVEQFKNIDKNYENYAYYKVADGVESFDAKDLGEIYLNGSFDGNGVAFRNANGYVFKKVGSGDANDEKQVVLNNFNVVFEGGFGVVGNGGAANLLFKDVSVTGYLLCDWNAGAFLRYGTRNGHATGFDYTVSFENCASNAEIYSTSNAYNAILVGHAYSGEGVATIKLDTATDKAIESTKLYYTGAEKVPFGYKYYCATANGKTKVYVDNKEVTNGKLTGANVVAVDSTKVPSKADSGKYILTTEADTTKVLITLNFQYSVYTDDTYAEKVPSENGVGGLLDTEITLDVIGGEEIDILESINSVEIVVGADKFDYEIKDGKLIIYVLKTNANIDGGVTLNVEQFTSGSSIAKYKGSVRIAERSALNNPEATWNVK